LPAPRLYQDISPLEPGQTVSLDAKASHHLTRVLRTRKDSEVILFNGDGHEYPSTLLDENSKKCCVRINEKRNVQNESPLNITLLQGISRSDRMSACLQKSTELGINAIIPVICEKTKINLKGDQATKKQQHWKQIIISACEQSGRCVIPELKPITTYEAALSLENSSFKIILDPDSKTGINNLEKPDSDICLMVGPEGGLTQNEIDAAVKNNFTGISLGPRILRTETAGPACIAAMQVLWGDLG
jgi:16S rRNA (uracil1498-N3)-methyltransferase